MFWWWDDAVAIASKRAHNTGVKHIVRRVGGMWVVKAARA